jgi:hypothetical protein
MSYATKLLVGASVLGFCTWHCITSGNWVWVVIGILLGLVSLAMYLVWLSLLLGALSQHSRTIQRCCPACLSRHYIIYPRGTGFGFAFPARFVKVTRTDFHCQNCGADWSMAEAVEHDADH